MDLVVSVTPACPSTPFGRVKPERKEGNKTDNRYQYFSYLTFSQAALSHIARNSDFWHAFLITYGKRGL